MPEQTIKQTFVKAMRQYEPGDVFSTQELIAIMMEHGVGESSVMPHDYCYNIVNKGTLNSYAQFPHLFEWMERGRYKYLGEGYPYSGTISHTPQKDDTTYIYGEWSNGILRWYSGKDTELGEDAEPYYGTVDFARLAVQNCETGEAGEQFALEMERKRLSDAGRPDLAEKVRLSRELSGNASPYDILSYDESGNRRYIEVKTTVSGFYSDFYLSDRELAFAREKGAAYCIYRVYELDRKTCKAKYTVIQDVEASCTFTPQTYRVTLNRPRE